MKVIGISGKAGSGKDYIVKNYLRPNGYYQVSLAWHFKVWIVATGRASYEEVFITKPPHIRELLQLEGTEKGRNVFGENVWVDAAFTWIRLFNDTWGVDRFVIADVRFPNEVEAILNHGGQVFRIHAPNRVKNSALTEDQRNHQSEIALDNFPIDKFSGVIFNDPTDNLEDMLNAYKII
jgi:hypothetical protein